MSFNYRLVQHTNTIGIYEIYYDENGKIDGYAEKPIIVGNDLKDLRGEIEHLKRAFDKPILIMSDLEEKKNV